MLDAGHGGFDPGIVVDGVREKDLALDYVMRIGRLLGARGVSVLYTRLTDRLIPLQEIVNAAITSKPDAFVSIHFNFGPPTLSGMEVFVSGAGHERSQRLAAEIRSTVCPRALLVDKGTKFVSKITLHTGTMRAACHVELAYLTNNLNRKMLISVDSRTVIVKGFADAIEKYLGSL